MAKKKDPMDDFQTQQDAQTLQDHAAITSDPKRHQAALDHLQKKHDETGTAIQMNKRKLRNKVKGGLKQAFPKDDGGSTPFAQAGKAATPFEEAGM